MWLGKSYLRRGRKHRLFGLSTTYEGDERIEERKVIEVLEETLKKHFPYAEIIKAKSVRDVCEQK